MITPSMIYFLLYLIGTVGMTSIIVRGVIFQPFRQSIGERAERARLRREAVAEAAGKLPGRSPIEFFNELISCTQCTGFWCGLFCGVILITPDIISTLFQLQNDKLAPTHQVLFPIHYFFVWFCCGTAGSFAASFSDVVLEWFFYNKMVALRNLEEIDHQIAEREAHFHENGEHT